MIPLNSVFSNKMDIDPTQIDSIESTSPHHEHSKHVYKEYHHLMEQLTEIACSNITGALENAHKYRPAFLMWPQPELGSGVDLVQNEEFLESLTQIAQLYRPDVEEETCRRIGEHVREVGREIVDALVMRQEARHQAYERRSKDQKKARVERPMDKDTLLDVIGQVCVHRPDAMRALAKTRTQQTETETS